MQILTQTIIMIILSIITHYIIAWAGSQLNEVGVVSREYANFTFRADRHGVMTTNILMNIFVPNVAMIFVFCLGVPCQKGFYHTLYSAISGILLFVSYGAYLLDTQTQRIIFCSLRIADCIGWDRNWGVDKSIFS